MGYYKGSIWVTIRDLYGEPGSGLRILRLLAGRIRIIFIGFRFLKTLRI